MKQQMKLFAYIILAITCFTNFIVSAYKPVSFIIASIPVSLHPSGLMSTVKRVTSSMTLNVATNNRGTQDSEWSFMSFTNLFGSSDTNRNKRSLNTKAGPTNNENVKFDVVGFMDYDPKTAAIEIHRASSHHKRRHNHHNSTPSSNGWFRI